MKKIKLEVEYDFNFLLFGIASHVKDYKLCWAINRKFNLMLEKQDDYRIKIGNGSETGAFPFYIYNDEPSHINYIVIANRGTAGYLIKEHKHSDYFFIIKGALRNIEIEKIMENLKSIDPILAVYEIGPLQLKSRQNLLFE